MNKPKFEVRNKHRKGGMRPEDELNEVLAGPSLNSPAAQSQETALASSQDALASSELAMASAETAQQDTQYQRPDQELQATLNKVEPSISEDLGISPEALNTEGFSSAEVAERHYGNGSTYTGLTATAPFVGMEREWSAEEKAELNGALRKYGWKDGTPPASEEQIGRAFEAAREDVAQRLGVEPQDVVMYPARVDGMSDEYQPAVLDYRAVMGYPTSAVLPIADALAEEVAPAPAVLTSASDAKVLDLLDSAREAIAKGWVKDVRAFMRELTFKLDAIPVTGKPGEFDESWVSNQSYFPKNLLLFVTRTPKVAIPGVPGDMLTRALELHTLSITGLKRGFRTHARDATRATQRFEPHVSCVRMEFCEKQDRVIGKMFEKVARRVCQLGVNENSTIDFMLIEPDATHTRVIDAWHCTDMWPSEAENADGERELSSARDPAHVDVTWSGVVERSDQIDTQAQELLDAFIVASSNPYAAP